jgi:catechol 2,3-dioxygenase-like lactoylglutathione lyase family enzyme
MKLEHIALDVSDPDKFIDWWCHNLGFRRSKPGSAFILDDTGVMGLEIYRTGETPQAPDYGKMNSMTLHVAFVSEDVKRDADRLVEAGAVLEQLTLDNPQFHMAILRDPWGMPIQLCKRANSIFFS